MLQPIIASFLMMTLFIHYPAFGKALNAQSGIPKNEVPLFMKALYEELHKIYPNSFAPEQLTGPTKQSAPVEKKPVKKELSRGEKIIQEQLAKTRAKIRAMRKESAPTADTPAGEPSLREQADKFLDDAKTQVNETLTSWKKANAETLKAWAHDQDKFLGRVKEYKKNLIIIPIKKPVPPKIIAKPIINPPKQNYYFIGGALDVPIKDQARRPTCSAFAGVRAMEVLVAQHGSPQDLSEQYFYWASKPDCQTSPCTRKGSWVTFGYDHSKAQSKIDVPLEKSCPYADNSKDDNETQVPLETNCSKGIVKINEYKEVASLDDTIQALKNNYPIIVGLKLTENFYRNKGYVFLSDVPKVQKGMDSHAKGHAVTLVGFVKLPAELKEKEGSVCFITANSWGIGWGKGGHACLSENWMKKYRGKNPFIALRSVETN